MLFLQPFELELRRDAGAELEKLVIQERDPHFEGMVHAEAIGDGEDVLGQIGFEVAVKGPVEGIGRTLDVGGVEVP